MSSIICGKVRGCVPLAVMPQGATFPVFMSFKNDEEILELYDGMDILIAFYNSNHKLILKCSTDDGRICYNDSLYTILISHEESRHMIGKIYVELTLTANNGMEVYHGDKVVSIDFAPRMNNLIL